MRVNLTHILAEPSLTVEHPISGSAFSNLAIDKYANKRVITVSGIVSQEDNGDVEVTAKLVAGTDVIKTVFTTRLACQEAKSFSMEIPIGDANEGTYKVVVTAEEV